MELIMKYKFVKHWSGMVLYVYAHYYDWQTMGDRYHWRKATDNEAYEIMCKLNQKD